MSSWIARIGAQIGARQDLFVIGLIVLIIGMLIVPLPTVLVDGLIAANIVLALIIFISTLYVQSVIEFASFPAVLLVTTLFRLALSISTTRLILLQGDAGHIITTFGEFVVGDNLVVGLVIFAIVTIVQFIVITKGSERIAEVVARFSLDAMPGKQMSLDGDARAGTIDNEQLAAARQRVEKESQLHGAFDGAMKFVKGDAIASMIIICVNLIGGVATGTLVHGMKLADAMTTYSLLSIGDGLVSQIPALLISVGAGFVVTRVASGDKNLGQQIVGDLFSHTPVVLICAVLSLAIGLLPGFPLAAFAALSAMLTALYLYRRWFPGSDHAGSEGRDADRSREADAGVGDPGRLVPITVRVPRVTDAQERASLAPRLRDAVRSALGVWIPEIAVEVLPGNEIDQVVVLLNEVPAATLGITLDRCLVPDFDEDPAMLGVDCIELADPDVASPSIGGTDWWVSRLDRDRVERLGYPTIDGSSVLEDRFVRLVARNVQELFGVQETKAILDGVERTHPELLKETYRHLPLIRITEILQRLIAERVPIRNTRMVLEAIALWAPREKDTLVLAEHVRASLAKTISARFLDGEHRRVIVVAPESEEQIRAGIRQVAAGAFLQMSPEQSQAFIDALIDRIDGLGLRHISSAVLLCAVDIRRFVKKLVERRYPELDVVSFAEVSDCVRVDIVASV